MLSGESKRFVVESGASFPNDPSYGMLFFNTTNFRVYVYTDEGWTPLNYEYPFKIVGTTGSNYVKYADYICTGTNDEVVIQQAINDLPIGGTLIFLDGVYNIYNPITIDKSNITLLGIDQTRVKFSGNNIPNASDPVILIGSSGYVTGITIKGISILNHEAKIHTVQGNSITIDRCTFSGPYTSVVGLTLPDQSELKNSTSIGRYFSYEVGDHCRITDNKFNSQVYGISGKHSVVSRNRFIYDIARSDIVLDTNSIFNDNVGSLLLVMATSSSTIDGNVLNVVQLVNNPSNVIVTNNTFNTRIGTASVIYNSQTDTATELIVSNNTVESIRLYGTHITVSNNKLNNPYNCITLYGTNLTITGNVVVKTSGSHPEMIGGISVVGGSYSTISGNEIYKGGSMAGIQIYNSGTSAYNITISNNTVHDSEYGIHIRSQTGSIDGIVITGNVLSGSDTGVYSPDASVGHLIIKNNIMKGFTTDVYVNTPNAIVSDNYLL